MFVCHNKFVFIYFYSFHLQAADGQHLGRALNKPGFLGNAGYQNLPNPNLAGNLGLIAAENAALNMGYGSFANGFAIDPTFANMAGYNQALGPFNGGGLIVTSSSPLPARGMTIQSDDLVAEGPLAVTGDLPFLGVVKLEGPLPATGQGAVSYGFRNGNVGITGENLNGTPAPFAGLPAAGVNVINAPGYGPYTQYRTQIILDFRIL